MATRVTGYSKYKRSLRDIRREVRVIASEEPIRSAERVRGRVVEDIRTSGAPGLSADVPSDPELHQDKSGSDPSGHNGRGGSPSKKHKPSAAGQPPNTDTGRLLTSYGVSTDPIDGAAIVGTNVIYARVLEEGNSKIRPRPHLLPRYYEELSDLVARTKRRFRRTLKKAKR